jgi:hypothetical protein
LTPFSPVKGELAIQKFRRAILELVTTAFDTRIAKSGAMIDLGEIVQRSTTLSRIGHR